MGTRVAYRILRWTVKNVSSSGFSPAVFRSYHLPLSCIQCRFLCSPPDQATPSQHNQIHPPPSNKPLTELSLSSLLEMGFTDSQARHICDSVSNIKRGSSDKSVLSTLTALFVLGLSPTSVQKMLDVCPELYIVKETLLQQRINHLRKLGLVEGSLQRMVVYYPKILTVPVKSVKKVVQFLREKCLFTTQQVTDLLRDSPAVVLEDLVHLEYKFQYVYFRMGVKQAEMVKCRLFRFALDDVRCRHTFLERRGLYQTPDKNGQATIINPRLDDLLSVDQETFVTSVAQASAEEYDVFQRLLAREWKVEELQQGRVEAYSDEDSDGDDDEEEEETNGRSGYNKRRKKK